MAVVIAIATERAAKGAVPRTESFTLASFAVFALFSLE
jgi:hypothetical protein